MFSLVAAPKRADNEFFSDEKYVVQISNTFNMLCKGFTETLKKQAKREQVDLFTVEDLVHSAERNMNLCIIS
jgi:hypothetical protein